MQDKILTKGITKEEYDWLVGLFLADGSRYIDKRGYCIYFYLSPFKDKEILKKLLLILKKMGFKPYVRLERSISTICVRFFSKALYHMLPTKYDVYHPKSKDAFIAGFLDGDGFIIPKKDCIGLTQKIVKWVCPFIHKYFEGRGIHSWYKSGVHVRYGGMQYYRTSLKQIKAKTHILQFMAKGKPYLY